MMMNKDEGVTVVGVTLKERRILLTICELISFLIANIIKTEKEWEQWGKPFLLIIFTSQFQDEGTKLLETFNEQFFPLIGHGISLWVEDTIQPDNTDIEHPDDNDYVIITVLEERLKTVLANFLLIESSEEELQNYLTQFLQRFYQHIEKIEHFYDSRERTIARKICSMLNISAQQFSELEREYHKPTDSSILPKVTKGQSISEENNLFVSLFQKHSREIPRDSLLVSYRMWRVAFVAAGGGAMVGMAGIVAAPTIITTVIPILSSACTFAQISITMDTFISSVGVLSYSLLPGIFTTYGATVAGSVMLKRTAEIKEFELIPLHIHDTLKEKESKELYQEKDITGLPIYILVNGHVEKNVDCRVMWGGNGSNLVLAEYQVSSVKEERKMITNEPQSDEILLAEHSAKEAEKLELNPIKETITLIQQDLIQETKVIADVILQSLSALKSSESARESFNENKLSLASTSFEEIHPDGTSSPLNDCPQEETPSSLISSSFDLHQWEELEYSYSVGWWKELIPHGEEYILQWENDILSHLNESFYHMIKNKISSKIMGHIKQFFFEQLTPLQAIKKSIGLPNLALSKIKQLDDIWVIVMDRANQGGKLLAKILMKQYSPSVKDSNASSRRPITLVGYGMGARLIYHCLEYLYQENEQNLERIRGMIENIVFIGAPVAIDLPKFQQFRSIVSNRFINCYSRYDWVLALLYRSKTYELQIAGLYPIHLPGSNHPTTPNQGTESKSILGIKSVTVDKQLTIELGDIMVPQVDSDSKLQQKMEELANRMSQMKEEMKSIENYDVTDLVHLQTDYPKVLPAIMQRIQLE